MTMSNLLILHFSGNVEEMQNVEKKALPSGPLAPCARPLPSMTPMKNEAADDGGAESSIFVPDLDAQLIGSPTKSQTLRTRRTKRAREDQLKTLRVERLRMRFNF